MSQQQHHRASSGHHPTQQQQQHPHMSSRNLMQYPTAPTAAPGSAASTDPTRPNPTALASSSGVILHQPYPNSVGIHPVQLQYTHHHQTAHSHRPTQSSSSSAAAPPPPIPTHTRPVDMPASPTRPGSTHYAPDPFSLSQYSLQRSMTPGPYMHSIHPIHPGPGPGPGSSSGAQYSNYLGLPKSSPPKENKCQYPSCDASFDRRYDLKRHILSRHQEPEFQCQFCLKKLSRSDALTRHFGTCANRAAALGAQPPRPTQ